MPGMLPLKRQLGRFKLRSSGSPPKVLGSAPEIHQLLLRSRMRSVRDAECAAATLMR